MEIKVAISAFLRTQLTSNSPKQLSLFPPFLIKVVFSFLNLQGLNLILRLAWLQTVLHSSFEGVDYRVTGLFLAALEVIRRGQWNFYR